MTQAGAYPMKLAEECSGVGEVTSQGKVIAGVRYRIRRFQGVLASGLPVPGVHRLEGHIDLDAVGGSDTLEGEFTLRLEDGRTLRLTLLGDDGSVLAEGHGPSRCSCC